MFLYFLYFGDKGILQKATQAKQMTYTAKLEESIKMAIMGSYTDLDLSIDNVKKSILNSVSDVQSVSGNSFPLSLTMKDGKKYIIKQNGTVTEAFKIKPVLTADMTPVYWNNTQLIETNELDSNWFNYDESKWANATTPDGSYWVWIPRFEYKITYKDETDYSLGGNIDIKFIDVSTTTPDEGYIIHPAFTDERSSNFINGGWDSNISGFWMAKFEMSMEENGSHVETSSSDIGNTIISDTIKLASKPNVTSWCNILPGNAYINSYNFDRAKESHLIKNSEWGAVAYLAYSEYGLNGSEICINTSTITGQSTGMPTATTSDINYPYDTKQGVGASTTGNITEIYDMSGGLWEFTASYDSMDPSSKLQDNGLGYFLKNDTSKYLMPYANTDNNKDDTYGLGKIGDAIKELRNNNVKKSTWFNDSLYIPYEKNPFSIRGGYNGGGDESGIFCAGYNSGSASGNKSFRTILVTD